MTGSIQVTTTRTENALVVPSRAVRRSGRTATVNVRSPGGATEPRQVTTGVTNGTLVQIVTGLQEGDEVLVSAPSTSGTTPTQGGQQQFFGPGGGGIQIR
jgi:hypothetical protein